MPILLRYLLFPSSSSSSSKLESHHNSLRAFESQISKSFFSQLQLPPTLSWVHHCLQFILPAIEEAFAKLISEIDHPMTSWESPSLHEQYLNDSFQFLQLLNSITASVSHLQQARLTISHALSTNISTSSSSSSSSLKLILPFSSPSNNKKNSRWEEKKKSEEEENDEKEKGYCSNKEEIIHKALLVMNRVRCFICMVVESSIRGGMELCLEEIVKEAGRWWFYDSSHLSVVGQEEKVRRKGVFVKEVDEINAGLSRILASDEEDEESKGAVAEELKEKVDVLGKKLEGIEEDVDRLFSEALARRNQLLDSLQDKGKK